MTKSDLIFIIKNNLRPRKGLIDVVKTYKTHGFTPAFLKLIFLIGERLKTNPGKFIISRQAIYLYEDSKHLTHLERILVRRMNNSRNNFKESSLTNGNILKVEEI